MAPFGGPNQRGPAVTNHGGVFKKVGRKYRGLAMAGRDLAGAAYLIDMAMWLLTSLQTKIQSRVFKSRDSLDGECLGHLKNANRLLGEAWREVQWVRRAAEVEEDRGMVEESSSAVKRVLHNRGEDRPRMPGDGRVKERT